ncbi:unnamed protein product [Eruca vesicaria subsp. sativa]|uniref:ADP-ribosyl cyclase/cyclic ADP-ribose hydrolase n=1 Tax=Eruca vesicaria subsp. sativa TaxID=29727 RepID=A0ABC8L564_ERUVS|nr:unnamed protein product [Eruca vesicaria subsp. sativa]
MTDFEKDEQFVCISCLEEVRYSFVSHLSEALRRKGINDVIVEVDSDDLLDSQAKVEKAKVSLLVLPGNSEPTSICRDKFGKVLEYRRNSEQVVVPVLYGDIPLQGEWLTELGLIDLSPLHQSREEFSDSILVEEIVRDVYEKLFPMGRIGIYSKLLEIETMVCKQPLGTRLVGVWGMPGIGKTTLAKAVFQQMCTYFDASCFIEDCEKAIGEKGLYRLLEEQLLKEHPGTSGTMKKASLLIEKLSSNRILVVLDGVGDPRVAESFLDGFEFGPESLIIITSRDKQVFQLCRINHIYEVQGLNEKEALQLFCSCASIKNITEQNMNELSMKVVQYANGNPLALSVFARELNGIKNLSTGTSSSSGKGLTAGELTFRHRQGQRTNTWQHVNSLNHFNETFFEVITKNLFEMESALLKLKQLKQHPPFEILDAFKRSYDTLSDSEKNIFLDIACFFQGEYVDYVMQLLDGCGFFPHVGIDVLVDKCLVIVSENRMWMHNLTQDVGRKLILGETVQTERHSRMWEPDIIKYLLEEGERTQGTEEIECMFLDTLYLNLDIKPAAFVNMLNLRLLKIYCSSPENRPNLKMLKTIRLCHSQQLVDIGDLSNAPNIKVIDLQGCTRLQSFQATDPLLHLLAVNLSGCKEIKTFQAVAPNIETLYLQGTGITELPFTTTVKPNSEELMSLLLAEFDDLSDALKLERLKSLKKSSSSCQYPCKLICLEIKDCFCLRSLPNMINLELLTVLDLSGCSKLETIGGLPRNLKELYLSGTAVRKVPQLPQSLELLNAHGCVSLKKIPLDSEKLPMHYIFTNCFNLSPQVVSDFLVKLLGNVKRIPRELPKDLNEAPAFSFCAPSHVNQDSPLVLQLGSSVMTWLNPSWSSTLLGFAMLVEIAFSEDYHDDNGFDISCVCRWKNEEGHSHKIERNLHCWAPRTVVPHIQKDHMFVFCDVNMRPSTNEGNDPDIFADLVVFEFLPVNKQKKRLDDTCTVTRCGVYVITAPTANTSLEDISPVLSLDPRGFTGNESEAALRVSYAGLEERYKALFVYMACLFHDEDVNVVAPLLSSNDVDVRSGLKELTRRSLIRVSSNGEIVMHSLLRKIWKEILHRQSILPGSLKQLRKDFEKNSLSREEEKPIVNMMFTSSSRNWKYDVYPCFRVEDSSREVVKRLLVAFKHKPISSFTDNEIGRGKLISPLRVQAIRESRISIVLLSKRFASSGWLLNELVEILKCREELGQIVMTIFCDVDPSDVKKQTGEFGRHFKQTYKSKTKDEERQCRKALSDITSIAGYHTINWDNEAEMIKKILADVSNKLNRKPSADFGGLVGIKAHIAKLNPLLHLESEEVKMIGIWGPLGIGKTTIARCLYNQIASKFQGRAFVPFLNGMHECGYSDNYSGTLYYQKLVLSEIRNEPDITIEDIGSMKEMLCEQKVLIILDGVDDRLVLDAVAGLINWTGPGSRIIVTTKDLGLLKSHGINHVYKVDLPSKKEALQILCRVAFRKNSPPDGFMQLATAVVESVGSLPLGLRVCGSYFRGMSEQEWSEELPRLRYRLDGEIESILRFGYDGLCEEDKDLFLCISCLFNPGTVEYLTRLLSSYFLGIKGRLRVLAEKSIIHMSEDGYITVHHLQQQLGREIVRKQYPSEPGKRKFLVYYGDISEVLAENTGTRSVEGISLDMSEVKKLLISEKGFNEMTNLQFLKFYSNLGDKEVKVHIPHGLDYLSHKLRLLHWEGFPMRCMPSNFIPKYLVELTVVASKLEELWSGSQVHVKFFFLFVFPLFFFF